MPITLEPAEVEALTGTCVSATDITVAAELIDAMTGLTVTQFVDESGISASSVGAAWAIVAVRVKSMFAETGDPVLTSESQGDYSYSLDAARVKMRDADLLDGVPRQLLRIGIGTWTTPATGITDIFGAWWNDPPGWVASRTIYDVV